MARHASGHDDGPPCSPDYGQPTAIPPRLNLIDGTRHVPTTAQNSTVGALTQHRLSMEQDYLYQEMMHHTPCQLTKDESQHVFNSSVRPKMQDRPPPYSCSVHTEAVFMMKLEVENATKRAEDRRWHQVYAILHGTTLNIHHPKKGWGWGGKKTDIGRPPVETWDSGRLLGPSEDRPIGVKAGKLVKTYGLLHSDVGIASDYRKRRYVIRVRADADQFLLSCFELETFIYWLDSLFAAIDIAAPLEDREFPRDQSIPRVQRLRWRRGEGALRPGDRPHPASRYSHSAAGTAAALARAAGAGRTGPVITLTGELIEPRASRDTRVNPMFNFAENGKWEPRHAWTRRHDMLYAKLCYSTLLFRSPRKSNYLIMKGDQWCLDWPTGRMARVRPPEYKKVLEIGKLAYNDYVGRPRI